MFEVRQSRFDYDTIQSRFVIAGRGRALNPGAIPGVYLWVGCRPPGIRDFTAGARAASEGTAEHDASAEGTGADRACPAGARQAARPGRAAAQPACRARD